MVGRRLGVWMSCALVAASASRPAWGEDAAAPAPSGNTWNAAVLPLPYYTPETSAAIAIQAMLVRSEPADPSQPRYHDTLGVVLAASLNRQYVASLFGTKYLRAADYRLTGEATVYKFPNQYWGVGNDTPDASEDYTPVLAGALAGLARRVAERVYAGAKGGFGYYALRSFAPGGLVAELYATRPAKGWLVGIGPYLFRDSRDDTNFPHAGHYTEASLTFYPSALGCDYPFTQLNLDHRSFFALPWSTVLAAEVYLEAVDGTPPIELMPARGGAMKMRGYFKGRYRDDVYTMAQLEWRAPLFWRLGAVAFAAVGRVAPSAGDLLTSDWKPAGGAGLRVNMGRSQPVNLRFDVAVGAGTFGFYATVGEAL